MLPHASPNPGIYLTNCLQAVAIVYMSIQTLYASYFVNVMLRCAFGNKWTNLPNRTRAIQVSPVLLQKANLPVSDLPPDAGVTSAQLASFVIIWLLQFPFAFVHPTKMTIVFTVKSVLAPIGMFATMIWALVRYQFGPREFLPAADGYVQVSSHGANFHGLGNANASGAALGWSFIISINTIVSNVIPPLVNIPDLARYTKRPRDTLPLAIGIVVSKPVVVFLGMIITAAGYKQFGKVRCSSRGCLLLRII